MDPCLPSELGHNPHMSNAVPAPWSKGLLTACIVVTGAALGFTILIAVFIDVQSDYLATRSELISGYDHTVLPPFFNGLWVIGNLFPGLTAIALALLIVARVAVGRRV